MSDQFMNALQTIGSAMVQAQANPGLHLQQRDYSDNPVLQKALQYSTGTSTIFGMPQLDPVLQLLLTYGDQILGVIPKRPGKGYAYLVNNRDEATEDLDASYVYDTADLDTLEATGNYTQTAFGYKIAAKRAKISEALILMGMPESQVFQDEIDARIMELKRDIVRAIFWGNKTTNPKTMDGLFTQCTSGQKLQAGSSVGGDPISHRKMEELLDMIEYGQADALMMHKRTRQDVSSLLQQQQQFIQFGEIKAGFRVMYWNGVPILVNKNIMITQSYNGTTTTANTGGNATSIFCVSWQGVWLSELLSLIAVPLGTQSCLFRKTDLWTMHTLVVRNPLAIAVIEGIYGDPLGSS